MKDKLTQEVEILGRSVSVLLIAGLLVVGGASAALLNQFATIDGEAEIDQAIVINDEGETKLGLLGADFEDTNSVTAGDVVVDDVFTIENNLDREANLVFENSGDGVNEDGTNFDWQGDAVTTRYADYFQDVGQDSERYDVSDFNDDVKVTEASNLTDLSPSEGKDVVVTEDIGSSSDPVEIDNGLRFEEENVNFYAEDLGTELHIETTGSSNAVYAANDGVTVTGFDLYHYNDDEPEQAVNAVVSRAADTEISFLDVNADFEEADIAILVRDAYLDDIEEDDVTGVEVTDNEVTDEDFKTGITAWDYDDEESVEVVVDVNRNELSNVETGVLAGELTDGELRLDSNRIEADEVDVWAREELNAHGTDFNFGDADEVQADDNFFVNGLPEGDRFDSVSYNTVVDTLDEGEEVEVRPVHEFALMADGSESYSLTTTVNFAEE